jgi:hypothetical protein
VHSPARAAGALPEPCAELVALARARAPLRRALARVAGRFVAQKGWERLGFARLRDYAVERLGLSARSLQDLSRVDAALARLPRIEASFVGGEIPWTKARLLARVSTPEDEAAWLARAQAHTARELAREVRAVDRGCLEAGGLETDEDGAPEERRESVRIWCRPGVCGKWFRTRQFARRVAGEALPVWAAMEAVAAEVASTIPVELPDEALEVPGASAAEEAESLRQSEATEPAGKAAKRGTAKPRETSAESGGQTLGRQPEGKLRRAANGCATQGSGTRPVIPLPSLLEPLVEGLEAADAFALDARLRGAVALEQRLEARMGPLLLALAEGRLYRPAGFANLETHARECLGLSPRKVRALLRLERAGRRCPALAAAFREGLLSWVKAHALVPVALVAGAPHREWIAWARRVTVRRAEDEVDRALVAFEMGAPLFPGPPDGAAVLDMDRERQMGARRKRSGRDPNETERPFFIAPQPVARFFRAVICSVRRQIERVTGRLPTEGEAFEAMLDHALEAWGHPHAKVRREHRVFERDGWRCTVPGCSSYRNLHDHHIRYRSAGGSDALSNRTTLCAWHHQRGVHAGRVRICGRAPEGLRIELGLRAGQPPLVAYRSGDVRMSG